MLEIGVSSEVQVVCHCYGVNWLLVLSSYMSLFNWIELFSKNCVDKVLRFSFRIGLNIRGVGLDGSGS